MAQQRSSEIADLKTKLQAIIFSIEDGIIMTDFEDNILVINDSAKRMLQIEKSYPYNKKFLDYIENEKLKQKFSDLQKIKEESHSIEVSIPLVPMEESFLKINKSSVTTAQGHVLGRMFTLRNITLEKQLEKVKDDFVHSIAHDLKSPLTPVQGFIRLLYEEQFGPLTKEQKNCMEIILLSVNRLLRLISNILDMAKLDVKKTLVMNKSSWDAALTIHHTVELLQEMARHQEINLFLSVYTYSGTERENRLLRFKSGESKTPPHIKIFADGELLERVIYNLVDNALKFTSSQGQIEIKLEDFSDRIEISVIDNGRGIPEDALKKIFQKFQQVQGTRGGTGLGLTIAKHIVEAHGGQLQVTSQLKKGSTFHFWIPKIKENKNKTTS